MRLDPSDMDALCARVFLSHYLCAWKGWKENLRLLEQTLRGPVMQRQGWGGTCDQPFRLFSYSLPADVAPQLTRHITAKEAASIPREHMLLHPPLSTGKRRELTLAYMSSDFGTHTVRLPLPHPSRHLSLVRLCTGCCSL